MEAIISYQDGRRMQVLVAMVGRFTMRVLTRDCSDAMELKSDYGQWVDETGAPVEFEALLAGEVAVWQMAAAQGASFEVV